MSVKIGGRVFNVMNMAARPFRVDSAQVALLQELGLDRTELLPQPDEEAVAYVIRLQQALIATRRIPDLLGHYLLPLGATESDWTPAMAAETAALIAGCSSEADRRVVYELAGEFVFGFFRSGIALLGTSQSFFLRALEGQAIPSQSALPAASSRSIPGLRWFARLRGTTTDGRSRSQGGRSARV